MKKLFLIAFISISLNVVAQNTDGIQFFEGSWAEILEKAKTENKTIFMDAYASWCGPCIRMAKDIFPLQSVGEFYNENFICVKIDMEKGEGPDLAKKYGVRAYPTFLFIDEKGELFHKTVGGKSAERFIVDGKIALDPKKNLLGIQKIYESDPTNVDKVILFCNELKKAYDYSYQAVAEKYLSGLTDLKLTDRKSWMITSDFIESIDSDIFKHLIANKKIFVEDYTADSVNRKINTVIEGEIYKAYRTKNEKNLNDLASKIKNLELQNEVYFLALVDLRISSINKDWEAYGKSVVRIIKAKSGISANQINSYAWTCFQFVEDQKTLKEITKLVELTIIDNDSYAIHDTWASLLFKTGEYEKAIEEANNAIVLAKVSEKDYSGTTTLIENIQKEMNK